MALVVVMAVMNGFRAELLDKILGINGHIIVQSIDGELTDYAEVAERISAVDGVVSALPHHRGPGAGLGPERGKSSGVLVRGVRGPDLLGMEKVADSVEDQGGLLDFDGVGRRGDRRGLCRQASASSSATTSRC